MLASHVSRTLRPTQANSGLPWKPKMKRGSSTMLVVGTDAPVVDLLVSRDGSNEGTDRISRQEQLVLWLIYDLDAINTENRG